VTRDPPSQASGGTDGLGDADSDVLGDFEADTEADSDALGDCEADGEIDRDVDALGDVEALGDFDADTEALGDVAAGIDSVRKRGWNSQIATPRSRHHTRLPSGLSTVSSSATRVICAPRVTRTGLAPYAPS